MRVMRYVNNQRVKTTDDALIKLISARIKYTATVFFLLNAFIKACHAELILFVNLTTECNEEAMLGDRICCGLSLSRGL